ncbi:hypothetical protein [Polaromonas sp. JS666]|uniref:hypothetical protein n=1 Tax=Polaromonas sp. (strain JS666 / ATCC BAA-500) TaxID=296591 RepID=UPI0000D5B494|nr:hypothetical protein [Polaromonas sp. JS666]ABE47073.1 hypothetical protein Bpro_5212 [Polaromonas sp. JS666]
MNLISPLLMALALALHPAHAAAPPAPKALIEQVERLTQLLKDSHAVGYPPATMVQNVKFTRYREGAIVVFNIEGFGGGNNHSQYLALFEVDSDDKTNPYYTLLDFVHIGGKGWRGVEELNARTTQASKGRDMVIEIDALEVGPEDAPNFPSKKIVIRLAVHGGRLNELSTSAHK